MINAREDGCVWQHNRQTTQLYWIEVHKNVRGYLSFYFEHTGHSSIDDDDVDDDRNMAMVADNNNSYERARASGIVQCVFTIRTFHWTHSSFIYFDCAGWRLTSLSISSYRHNLFMNMWMVLWMRACAFTLCMVGSLFGSNVSILFYFLFVFIKV